MINSCLSKEMNRYGVVVNELDCDIIISKLEIPSPY